MTSARQRVLIAIAAVGVLGLLWETRRAIVAYRSEGDTFFPPVGRVAAPPDSAALGLTDVSFPARNGATIRGWYVPSRRGSAVVLDHGSGATRESLVGELRLLAEDGHGVLAIDNPGHGESGGAVAFGLAAVPAVEAAVDFLTKRPDVDSARIGALGFSFGGVATANAAAADCRIRAVALVASPADTRRQVMDEYRPAGYAAILGGLAVYAVHGIDLRVERAVEAVGKISPRPIEIFGGREDRVVSLDEANALFGAAGSPKSLVVVNHGGHGQYARLDSGYRVALRAFFDTTIGRPTPQRFSPPLQCL